MYLPVIIIFIEYRPPSSLHSYQGTAVVTYSYPALVIVQLYLRTETLTLNLLIFLQYCRPTCVFQDPVTSVTQELGVVTDAT